MGGNSINYPDDCGTPTVDILTIKLLFYSIISTPNSKFMTIYIKDFYLMTPLDSYKYFRMILDLSHRTSLMNMHSMTKWMWTAMFSAKCAVICTTSHRPA